jgi:hypothetical protein
MEKRDALGHPLARKKPPASRIAKKLKRSEGAARQKAFSMGLSLDSRA